jgi:hypothetical protein
MPIALGNVTTTAANIYVSIGNTTVSFLSLTNYSASNVTANLYVVPAGDTAGNTNIVLSELDITTKDTYQFYAGGEKLLLSNGDALVANVSANAAVTTVVSYLSF